MDREELTELHAAAVAEPAAEQKPERLDPQPAVAHAPWVKSISSYERKETTIVEGLRYG